MKHKDETPPSSPHSTFDDIIESNQQQLKQRLRRQSNDGSLNNLSRFEENEFTSSIKNDSISLQFIKIQPSSIQVATQIGFWSLFHFLHSYFSKQTFETVNDDSFPLLVSWISFSSAGLFGLSVQRRSLKLLEEKTFFQKNFQWILILFIVGSLSSNYAIYLADFNSTNAIKCCAPIFVVFWIIVGIDERPNWIGWTKILWMIFIVGGLLMTNETDDLFSLGIVIGITSCFSLSMRDILLKNMMNNQELNVEKIFYKICLGCGIILTPFALFFGDVNLLLEHPVNVGTLIFSFYSYHYFSLRVLERTEIVSHSIINASKRIFISLYLNTINAGAESHLLVGGIWMVLFGNLSFHFSGREMSRKKIKFFLCFILISIITLLSRTIIESRLDPTPISYNLKTPPGIGCEEIVSDLQSKLIVSYKEIFNGISFANILGYIETENKGDAAIWVAQQMMFASMGITTMEICRYKLYPCISTGFNVTLNIQPHRSAIVIAGGGNTNDFYWKPPKWEWVIHRRLDVFKSFPNTPIRSFPQSVYFSHPDRLEETLKGYEIHKDNHVCARDQPSFDFLKEHFEPRGIKISLTPDIVFFFGNRKDIRLSTPKKWDILFMMREDKESIFAFEVQNGEGSIHLENVGLRTYSKFDWDNVRTPNISGKMTANEKAWPKAKLGFEMLASAHFIVTDRLHGHIMATLIGIPHVLLDSKLKKNLGFHDTWTKDCNCVRIAGNPQEAMDIVKLYFRANPKIKVEQNLVE